MQSRHFPFAFLTSTTLASHSGYSTSLIAPACRSLLTSSLMAFCLSGAKLLLFCLIGLKGGLTFSLWVITVGSIPPNPQAIPIDLDTIATAQATKNPLPTAPSTDQVYILPASQSQHKTPAAPKAKSNPLHVVQNFKELVASVHALATTSKTMATAYIAWHSGWFGCGFGFGTPGPRHF